MWNDLAAWIQGSWQITAVIALLVAGAVLTALGLFGAVRSLTQQTRRHHDRATKFAIAHADHVSRVSDANSQLMRSINHAGEAGDFEFGHSIPDERTDIAYAIAGYHDAVFESEQELSDDVAAIWNRPESDAHPSQAAVFMHEDVLAYMARSNSSNLWLVGTGIFITTVASIWSLFI